MSDLLSAVLSNDSLINPGWADRRGDKENLGHYVTKEEATQHYKEMIKTKKDYLGATPLHKAARKGDANKVLSLLNEGVNIEGETRTGYTPLHYSAMMGQTEVCRLLLERAGHNGTYHLLAKRNKNGWTPLHSACENNRVDTAILLIEFGADLGVKDNQGRKPLDLARISRLPQIQDKVTNAIVHYANWNRRKGLVYLLCLLKDAQDTYHKQWKALVPTAFENSPSRKKSLQILTSSAHNDKNNTIRAYSPARENAERVPTSPPRIPGQVFKPKESFTNLALKREKIGLKRIAMKNMKDEVRVANHASDVVAYTYDDSDGNGLKKIPFKAPKNTKHTDKECRGRTGADSGSRSTSTNGHGTIVAAKYEYVVPDFHDHHIHNDISTHHDDRIGRHHLIHNPTDLYFQAKIRGIQGENLHRYKCAGYENAEEYYRLGVSRYGPKSLQLWPSCRDEGVTVDHVSEAAAALEKVLFFKEHVRTDAVKEGYSEREFLHILKTKHRNTRLRQKGVFNWEYNRYYAYGVDDLHEHKARNTLEKMRERIYREDRHCSDSLKACWQEMQNLDLRRHVEYRLVRRIRSRYTGHYLYFREDKEFLTEDKGVDPKLQLMAFCLLKENVYRLINSYL